MVYLAPSLLSADMARLAEAVASVASEADYIHCDVMDGHFVPNLTFGAPVVKAVKRISPLPLDVHLMIETPSRWLDDYVKAGLDGKDFLTFHLEAEPSPDFLLTRIRAAGIRPGLAIKPCTPYEKAAPFLALADQLLVMTVEPGFGGQQFMPDMVAKVSQARAEHPRLVIGVDGGINHNTATACVRAGANLLAAGSSVFGEVDPREALRRLRRVMEEVSPRRTAAGG